MNRLEAADWPRFLEQLGRSYELLAPDPLAFARETRVVPLRTPTAAWPSRSPRSPQSPLESIAS